MTNLISSQEQFLKFINNLKQNKGFVQNADPQDLNTFIRHFKKVLDDQDVQGVGDIIETIHYYVENPLLPKKRMAITATLIKIKLGSRVQKGAKAGAGIDTQDGSLAKKISLQELSLQNEFSDFIKTFESGKESTKVLNHLKTVFAVLCEAETLQAVRTSPNDKNRLFVNRVNTKLSKDNQISDMEALNIMRKLINKKSVIMYLEDTKLFNKEVRYLLESETLIRNYNGSYDKYLNAMENDYSRSDDLNVYNIEINTILKTRTSEDPKTFFSDSLADNSAIFSIAQLMFGVFVICVGNAMGSGWAASVASVFYLLNGLLAPALLTLGKPGYASRCLFWSMLYSFVALIYAWMSIDISYADSKSLQETLFNDSYNAYFGIQDDPTSEITGYGFSAFIDEFGNLLFLKFSEQFINNDSSLMRSLNWIKRTKAYLSNKKVQDTWNNLTVPKAKESGLKYESRLESYVETYAMSSKQRYVQEDFEKYTLSDMTEDLNDVSEILKDPEGQYDESFKNETRKHIKMCRERGIKSTVESCNQMITTEVFNREVLADPMFYMYVNKLGPHAIYLVATFLMAFGNIGNMALTEINAFSNVFPFMRNQTKVLKFIGGLLLLSFVTYLLRQGFGWLFNGGQVIVDGAFSALKKVSDMGYNAFFGLSDPPQSAKDLRKKINRSSKQKLTSLMNPVYPMYLTAFCIITTLSTYFYYYKKKSENAKTKQDKISKTDKLYSAANKRLEEKGIKTVASVLVFANQQQGKDSINFMEQAFALQNDQSKLLQTGYLLETRKQMLPIADSQQRQMLALEANITKDTINSKYKDLGLQGFRSWYMTNKNKMDTEADKRGRTILQSIHNKRMTSTRFRFT